MKIKTKIILSILFAAMLPLVTAMTVALWHSTEQLRTLTVDSAQGYLQVGAGKLSGYFARRISEISTYARIPLMQTMDWRRIGPVLSEALEHHSGVYEKLVIGTPAANYYSTSGGNPALGGLTSFDDKDPGARLKTMARREYWRFLVGTNRNAEPRTYVSEPIISYTTGIRQVLVGVTILSGPDHRVLGMLGGTIPWEEIESQVVAVREGILRDFGRLARLSLVTKSGVYVYHWDPAKTIYPKLDAEGKPVLNEIGEKVSVQTRITDEPSEELARAGREMIRGKSGFAFFDDPETGQTMVVIYAPVVSADYAMAMMVPRNRILAPVKGLERSFAGITLISVVFALTVSLLLVGKITRPIEALTKAARGLSGGNWRIRLESGGRDEVGKLARTFSEMAGSLEKRETALKQSEKNYRTFIRNLPIGIYRNTPGNEGRFIIANPAIAKMFGFDSVEAFMEIRVSDLYADAEDRRHLSNYLLSHDRVINRELRLKRKDGQSLWGELTAMAVRDANGDVKYFEGAIKDVSERKGGEKALRRSEEQYRNLYETSKKAQEVYRSLLNSSADAIVLYDMEGKTVYLSPAFTRMFGWSLEEVKDKRIPFVPDSEMEATTVIIKDLVRNGTPCHGFETKRTTRSGQNLNVSISASRYNDHKGEPIGVLAVLRDISDRIKLEKQLQHAVKMEAIGTLAGGIAHDFNNLMMAMLGNLSLLLMDMDPDHSSYDRLKKIEKLIQNGSRLTNQLLGYARKGKYEIAPVDLNQTVRETAEAFGRTRKEISIHYQLAEDLWSLEADPAQTEQILMNLYVNASDAMPGGGDLYLKTRNITHRDFRSEVYNPKPGNYVMHEVVDTGEGMDDKTAERIFDPFFTTKEMGRGTGLGLASVFGIIKGHGGYIDVASKKGEGTIFSIYLPASDKKIATPSNAAPKIVKGNETILVVDDEAMVLDVGVQLLEAMGYTVKSAASGTEAIEIYRRHGDAIDMVILDMVMPDMGGGEVFDRFRQINPIAKILLSSGYSIDGKAREILARGCNGFIQKPFSMEKLSEKIRETLLND